MDKFMGPWTWENDEETLDFFNVVNAEGGVVAMVPKGPTEEIRDRQYDMARAISALPRLVKACNAVMRAYRDYMADDTDSMTFIEFMDRESAIGLIEIALHEAGIKS